MIQNQPSTSLLYQREYKIIKADLLRLVILNAIYLAGLLLLYFTNQSSHYLDKWLASVFRF